MALGLNLFNRISSSFFPLRHLPGAGLQAKCRAFRDEQDRPGPCPQGPKTERGIQTLSVTEDYDHSYSCAVLRAELHHGEPGVGVFLAEGDLRKHRGRSGKTGPTKCRSFGLMCKSKTRDGEIACVLQNHSFSNVCKRYDKRSYVCFKSNLEHW